MAVHRRDFLTTLGATVGAWALPDLASATIPTPSLRDAARDAWIYCLPLIEMAGARARGLVPLPNAPSRVNLFGHARTLAGPDSRAVTTPNNDTLYSTAWIDLSGEPVTLVIPPTGERYFSLALMDMFTNNFAVLGTRTLGGDGATITLAGPRSPAEPGVLRSPTNWVWALGRTLVDGPDDLAAAHAVQDGLRIIARQGGRTPGPPTPRDAPWNAYFGYAQRLLADNPPPVTDMAFFRRIRLMQLGPTGGFERARFSDDEMEAAAAGVEDAKALLRSSIGAGARLAGGWTYPDPHLGDYGQDYLLRARTALGGLAALPPAEAVYLRPVAPDGRGVFDGPGRWRLRLPGQLPVNGFWSVTMYEATPEGQFFLTRNPINRYAIGDRTPGFGRGSDGAYEILFSRDDPGGADRSIWLPAPASGPWTVSFRAYLPTPDLMDGRYRLPALVPDGDRGIRPDKDGPPLAPNPNGLPVRRRRRRRR